MQHAVQRPDTIRGALKPPGDKSISHRSAIFGAIAAGDSVIDGFLPGEDCFSTIACLERMGVGFQREPSENGAYRLTVHGSGRLGLKESSEILDAGNSGTTLRLLTGLLAGQPLFSVLTGDASLRSRPMGRVLTPLRRMGATVMGRGGDQLAPLAIRGGNLHGIDYALPVASAQLKSALILAAMYADTQTILTEPGPARDHTELMLRSMGAGIDASGGRIAVHPLDHELAPLRARIPADMSSAFFWLVLGACHPNAEIVLTGVGMNATRRGALDVLMTMGADIELRAERTEGGEPIADLVVRSSVLHGTAVGGEVIPRAIDEIPALALAAAMADGDTIIHDAAELRVKESDRIHTTSTQLRRLGASIEEAPDGMTIHGGRPLRGAVVNSSGDHRLAMTLAIAGLLAEGETAIEGAECVEISYPSFWADVDRLTA